MDHHDSRNGKINLLSSSGATLLDSHVVDNMDRLPALYIDAGENKTNIQFNSCGSLLDGQDI